MQYGSGSSLLVTQFSGIFCKQNSSDSPNPNPSSSTSYQYSSAVGLKQPHPKSSTPPPAQTPHSSIIGVTGSEFQQNSSKSTLLGTQFSGISCRHNSSDSPNPNPSPSTSYQYFNAAGLKHPQPKSSSPPPEQTLQ